MPYLTSISLERASFGKLARSWRHETYWGNLLKPMKSTEQIKEFIAHWASNWPILVLILRLFLAVSIIWFSHVVGYANRIGAGLGGLVGLEIADDLLFDLLSTAVNSIAIFGPITFLIAFISPWQKIKSIVIYIGITLFILNLCFEYVGSLRSASLGISNRTWIAIAAAISLAVGAFFVIHRRKRSVISGVLLISSAMAIAYYLGESKANEGWLRSSRVFHLIDGTKISGHILHRIDNGLLVKKANYFPFDIGVVFIPYSAIIIINESVLYQGSPEEGIFRPEVTEDDYPPIVPKPEQ